MMAVPFLEGGAGNSVDGGTGEEVGGGEVFVVLWAVSQNKGRKEDQENGCLLGEKNREQQGQGKNREAMG